MTSHFPIKTGQILTTVKRPLWAGPCYPSHWISSHSASHTAHASITGLLRSPSNVLTYGSPPTPIVNISHPTHHPLLLYSAWFSILAPRYHYLIQCLSVDLPSASLTRLWVLWRQRLCVTYCLVSSTWNMVWHPVGFHHSVGWINKCTNSLA